MGKLLFIAGTHGNEKIGVDALKEVERTYDSAKYNYDWIIGNPRAFNADVRFTEKDLNRSAPGNIESRVYEERRAAEIVELSGGYDAVIDLHGTIASCGVVTLIPYPTAENLGLARRIRLPRNVIWYAEESQISGPLTQHTTCPAVEIECGPKSDSKVLDQLKEVLGKLLATNIGQNPPTETTDQEFYEVYGSDQGNNRYYDFQAVTVGGETFYPFLSSQYEGVACYKMRRTSLEEAAL